MILLGKLGSSTARVTGDITIYSIIYIYKYIGVYARLHTPHTLQPR